MKRFEIILEYYNIEPDYQWVFGNLPHLFRNPSDAHTNAAKAWNGKIIPLHQKLIATANATRDHNLSITQIML